MKYVIVEDEPLAAEKLLATITAARPHWQHLATMASKEKARKELQQLQPDLAFVDIHLADGLSFDIFKDPLSQLPLIFTTAYDKYALKAFELNSIDYLLKPVGRQELERALHKWESRNVQNPVSWEKLMKDLQPAYKERFLVSTGQKLKTLATREIAFFHARGKHCFITDLQGREFLIDHSLNQLMESLDPREFFQVNRQYIVALRAIEEMIPWSKSRLKVVMRPSAPEEVVVSVERSPRFKSWLAGEKA